MAVIHSSREGCRRAAQWPVPTRRLFAFRAARHGPTRQQKGEIMPNLFDLPALDSQLKEILKLLESRKPSPMVVATTVNQFRTDYTSDELGPRALFGERCRENWKAERRFYGTKILHIEELEDHARDKLEAVCEGMMRLLEESHSPLDSLEHTEQLRNALRRYLNCRDPKVGLPAAVKTNKRPAIFLTPEEQSILEVLAEEAPMTVTEQGLADATHNAPNTVRKYLTTLRARKLVDRPRGRNKGNGITAAGLHLIGQK